MARLKLFIPLLVFAMAAVLFASILKKRETQAADYLPSALVGKAFPEFVLPKLELENGSNALITNRELPQETF